MIKKEWYKYVILFACMFPYCMSTLVRWNYTSISGYLMTDFGIGKAELGMLASIFFYGYTLSQLPSGLAVDKWGGRWVIPTGVCLMGVFSLGFAMSEAYTQAMVFRGLLGLVGATVYVPAVSLLAKWFPAKQRGLANNIFNGFGGGLGEIIMFIIVPLIALFGTGGFFGFTGWRLSTVIVALVIIAIAVCSFIFLRSDPTDIGLESVIDKEEKENDSSESFKSTRMKILKDPLLYGLCITWCGYIIATRLVLGWMATYASAFYVQVMNMPKAEAMVAGGAIASIYVAGRYLGAPLSGIICDYLLKKHFLPRSMVLLFGLIVATILFACLGFMTPNAVVLSTLTFLCGFIFNFYSLVNACAAELWPARAAGFSMGVINTIAQLLGAVSLSVSGYAALKFAVAGGPFHTEYSGIWFCGILTSGIAALVTVYVMKRERKIWMDKKDLLTVTEGFGK